MGVGARPGQRADAARIVHITDTYPPQPHPVAGQVAGLARHQGSHGAAVHVLTATPLPVAEPGQSRFRASTTDAPGVRVHRLAFPLAFGLPVLPRGRATIERALRLLRPDVVHLHLGIVSPFGYDAARAARVMDLPLVITWYSILDGPEALARFGLRIAGWQTAPFVPSGATTAITASVASAFSRPDALLIPLGTDLAPWQRAARHRATGPEPHRLRVLINAADGRASPSLRAALAAGVEVDEGIDITLTGASAGAVPAHLLDENVTLIPDPPEEVLPALAREHDVYLSAGALDPHAAGARAAGLVVLAHEGTSAAEVGTAVASEAELMAELIVLARRAPSSPAVADLEQGAAGSWAEAISRAQEAYAAAEIQARSTELGGQ